jgi:hypothetical protein
MCPSEVTLVIVPGVSDGQRLQNTTDGLPGLGRQQQVKVVGHQTIAIQLEGIAALRLSESTEKQLAQWLCCGSIAIVLHF